jgi:hypothetical protein
MSGIRPYASLCCTDVVARLLSQGKKNIVRNGSVWLVRDQRQRILRCCPRDHGFVPVLLVGASGFLCSGRHPRSWLGTCALYISAPHCASPACFSFRVFPDSHSWGCRIIGIEVAALVVSICLPVGDGRYAWVLNAGSLGRRIRTDHRNLMVIADGAMVMSTRGRPFRSTGGLVELFHPTMAWSCIA